MVIAGNTVSKAHCRLKLQKVTRWITSRLIQIQAHTLAGTLSRLDLLTALCLEVRSAGLRSCSPFSVSLETSSSDSSQDEEKPAEEAEEDDSFLRERLEFDPGTGLELGLGVEHSPWSEPGPSEVWGWLSKPWSVIMTAGMEGEGLEVWSVRSIKQGELSLWSRGGARVSGLTSDLSASVGSSIPRHNWFSFSSLASFSVLSLTSPSICLFSTSPPYFSPSLLSVSAAASGFNVPREPWTTSGPSKQGVCIVVSEWRPFWPMSVFFSVFVLVTLLSFSPSFLPPSLLSASIVSSSLSLPFWTTGGTLVSCGWVIGHSRVFCWLGFDRLGDRGLRWSSLLSTWARIPEMWASKMPTFPLTWKTPRK